MPTRVKVCCISSVEEARIAVRHGASALGLVSAMPSGPGVISDESIAEIARAVPAGVASFLLTSRQEVGAIVEQQRFCGTNTIQICDRIEDGAHALLRQALPGISIVQVIHVEGMASLAEAQSVAPLVDAILLDSGRPDALSKELGGTGRVHDWDVSRAICAGVDVPVYLAGGLNPNNVAEAIRAVRPFGLDLCSGLRTAGQLDADKVAAFFAAVAGADAA